MRYRPPAEGKRGDITVRVDAGVHEGVDVSIYYDPMIAKVCTLAPTRMAAIDAMAGVLDEFAIAGVRNNVAFLGAVMHHPRFREGRLSRRGRRGYRQAGADAQCERNNRNAQWPASGVGVVRRGA